MHKLLFTLCLFLCVSSVAQAHKVVTSAWLDGNDIEGEVGFSSGDMAVEGTLVVVQNDKGEKIGETRVDGEGLFRFTPTLAIPHTFVANLGAGHVAKYVMSVDELPTGLQNANTSGTPAPTKTKVDVTAAPDLEQLIAKAVRREVQPLRKEIAQYKEKNDLQAILGGLGYILGLTGIYFFIQARRQQKQGTNT